MKKEKQEEKKKKKRTKFVRFIRRTKNRIRIRFRRHRASKYTKRRLLDVYELSVMLAIPVPTLYNWVHEKRLPTVKLAKNLLRFAPEEIERWIESRKVNESEYWHD